MFRQSCHAPTKAFHELLRRVLAAIRFNLESLRAAPGKKGNLLGIHKTQAFPPGVFPLRGAQTRPTMNNPITILVILQEIQAERGIAQIGTPFVRSRSEISVLEQKM